MNNELMEIQKLSKEIKWTKIGDLEWSDNLREMNWEEAMQKAKDIGARLPTRTELVDLFDNHYEESQDLIKDATGYHYWSSTEYNSGTANAWNVYLYSGSTNNNNKTTNRYAVRCVRNF